MAKKDEMKSLFDEATEEIRYNNAPLAVRMRPRNLDEYIGQKHILGKGKWLRGVIENDNLSPMIFYGPAGTGKTSLARVIAETTSSKFEEVSAVSGGVADLKKAIESAKERLGLSGQKTIVFVDEIHRFNKTQQDALLHAVEDRDIILIGATTENPLFEVNAALVSRSRIVELYLLSDDEIDLLIDRTLEDVRGYGRMIEIEEDARKFIITTAGGDARVALTTLELAEAFLEKDTNGKKKITLESVKEASPSRIISYDKTGDNHYDITSAFIKSMRGSDPDAAVYYLARMIHGGEDPKFIARRMMIFASEDIGNADPQALLIAHAAFKTAESIGWPECRINLAQAAIYMALAPKSNASYMAIGKALEDIETQSLRAVPSHLRDRHRPGSNKYDTYRYPHEKEDGWVKQQYLPDGLEAGCFYQPKERGWEKEQSERLKKIKDK